MTGGPLAAQALVPTLGDILAAALSHDPERERREMAERAQYLAACELARHLAPLLRLGEAEVFDALTYVPDEMLPLLETPEGWSTLAAHVAADLGVLTVTYSPTRH